MNTFWRYNGLSLVLAGIFLVLLGGQAWVGWRSYNDGQMEHAGEVVSFPKYLKTGHFWEAVFENWESEFLQMGAYVLLTTCLFQKGSAESNDPDGEEAESSAKPSKDSPGPVQKGGWYLKLYEHSLSLALLTLFVLSFLGHLFGGLCLYNEENVQHGKPEVAVGEYIVTSQFWFECFQNWQSEFLAVLSLVVLSVWLREKGSSESKKVEAPHSETGK
jgi:hypothetical protein